MMEKYLEKPFTEFNCMILFTNRNITNDINKIAKIVFFECWGFSKKRIYNDLIKCLDRHQIGHKSKIFFLMDPYLYDNRNQFLLDIMENTIKLKVTRISSLEELA